MDHVEGDDHEGWPDKMVLDKMVLDKMVWTA